MAGRKLRRTTQRRKSRGGHYKRFRRQLFRYNFAYAGRDTVNPTMKGLDSLAPKLIKHTSDKVDKLAKSRINKKISEGGSQTERIAPKIIRGAIEDVCKTPFKLLGSFGR